MIEHDCGRGYKSFLGRAADTYVTVVADEARDRELVWYRRDFGTEGGWREIRGLHIVEMAAKLEQIAESNAGRSQVKKVHASWYFDRLGKLERFRRQIYGVTLSRYTEDLWLGLMTVIEWPKDLSESSDPNAPAYERDGT